MSERYQHFQNPIRFRDHWADVVETGQYSMDCGTLLEQRIVVNSRFMSVMLF